MSYEVNFSFNDNKERHNKESVSKENNNKEIHSKETHSNMTLIVETQRPKPSQAKRSKT